MSAVQAIALYVHLPWCVKKCPYCDFNSHAISGRELSAELEQRYLEAVLADLERDYCAGAEGRQIATVFFGGGTPSLLSAAFYQRFIDTLNTIAPVAGDAEISLEANPGAIDAQRFAGYRAAGINRLSIGVQSFASDQLKALGRVHSVEEAHRAFALARASGFDNINIDLMYGLPGQTLSASLDDLQCAIDCEPEHLSWYQLTIEPNTAFYNTPPTLPADEQLVEMSDTGQSLLANAGFQQYEVSAYARDGYICRHNDNYWRFGDYLGVGAGAHGKVTSKSGGIRRYWKYRQPDTFLDAIEKTAGDNLVEAEELVLEYMMNVLRRRTGFSEIEFGEATGLSFTVVAGTVDELCEQRLLERSSGRIQATAIGAKFLNEVIGRFAS